LLNADKTNLDCLIYPNNDNQADVLVKVPLTKNIATNEVPEFYIADVGIRNAAYT
jgi:hypothetical protein